MRSDANTLSQAVIVYLAFGEAAWPQANGGRLLEAFGPEEGRQLEARVSALLDELGTLQVDWSAHSLQSAGEVARAEMRARHPELSEEAVRALAWRFTYDWR